MPSGKEMHRLEVQVPPASSILSTPAGDEDDRKMLIFVADISGPSLQCLVSL